MTKALPLYELYIEEDLSNGVDLISLVENPAIQVDFVALSAAPVMLAALEEGERRWLTGPALIPNQLIYRNDGGREYNIQLSTKTVRTAAERFAKLGLHGQTNLEHNVALDSNYVVESWIVEGEHDKSQNLGFNLPVGTWMVSMKVEDDNVWALVKAGKVKGFSIEGFFDHIKMSEMAAQIATNTKQDKSTMKDFKDFLKFAFGAAKVSLADASLDSGENIVINQDTQEVRYVNPDGTLGDPLADGSYTLSDGTVIEVAAGLIAAPVSDTVVAQDVVAADVVTADPAAEMLVLTDRITALETALADLTAMVTGVQASAVEAKDIATKLAKQPAVTSLNDLDKVEKDTRTAARKLRDAIQNS